MASKFNQYQDLDLNGNEIKEVSKVTVQQDAQTANELVRKSQAESIASNELDGRLISDAAQASGSTAFTSQYTKTALDTKQPTMAIHPDSTAFAEILNGYQLRIKELLVMEWYVEQTATTLAAFIDSVVFNGNGTITTSDSRVLDAGTIVILENASVPQEKSFLYAGTNAGDATDFATLGTELNSQVIRSMLSAAGKGQRYDALTGQISIEYGTGSEQLGAQIIPIDEAIFASIQGTNVKDAIKNLETLALAIEQSGADGTAAVTVRIDNLIGVSGANLGTFAEGIFTDNSSVKAVLQESETAHKNATNDRALIRAQFAAADTVLTNNLNIEAANRQNGDLNLASLIASETSARQAADNVISANLSSEETARIAGDDALDARLDVVEGSGVGSIAKAEADAKAYADQKVADEAAARIAADAALDQKIDNLAQGDIKFIGLVLSDGSLQLPANVIAAGDTRNGLDLKDVGLAAGETFIADEGFTLVFNDSSQIVLQKQDKLLCTQLVAAGSATEANFNVVQNTDSALTDANLDGLRIEKTAQGKLDIVDDSIGRDQLDPAIEADVDDKRSSTQPNAITSDGDTHFVSSSDLGAQQNRYSKRTQVGADALTGTFRTELIEAHVNTNGSGDPLALSAAQAQTSAAHYQGACQDMTVLLAGGNFEANAKAGTAVQATGLYALAPKPQNGINIGLTAYANGAAFSNVGVVGVAGTAGVGRDRGGLFAVAAGSLEQYSVQRQAVQFPFNDIALTADARFGPSGCIAFYAYGDVRMNGGKVEVEQAPSTDESVMRLGDVKGKEKCFQMDLSNGIEKLVPCSLDLNKALIQVVNDNQTIGVQVIRDVANSQLKVTAMGGNLTAVRVLVKELECDVVTV